MNTPKRMLLIALVAFTAIAIFQTFWGEKISVNGGLGWDGQRYAVIIRDMDYMLKHEQMDNFHLKRITTLWLVNKTLKVLTIPVSHHSIVWVFASLNLVCYLLSLTIAFLIIRPFSPQSGLCISLFFGNLYFCKLFFFYPVLTDSLAILCSFIMLWLWIRQSTILLFIATLVTFFTYPILPFIGLILCVFPFYYSVGHSNSNEKKSIFTPLIAGIVIVALFSIYLSYDYLPNGENLLLSSSSFIQENQPFRVFNIFSILVIPAILLLVVMVTLGNKLASGNSLKISIDNVIKTSFYLYIFLLIYIIIQNVSPRIAPTISTYTADSYIQSMLLNSSHLPFKNWVAHIQFFGFIVLFPFLIIQKFYSNQLPINTALLAILCLFVIQSIDCESRHLLIYLPYILFLASQLVQNLKTKAIVISMVIILLFAKFGVQIEPLSEARALPFGEWQRFFKYHGPWMSEDSYIAAIPTTLLIIGLFIWYARKSSLPPIVDSSFSKQ